MSSFKVLSRLTLAATASFVGVSAIANGPSGASASAAGAAHSVKVVYPTVAEAATERAQQAASTRFGSSSTFALSSHGGLDGIEVTIGAPKVYLVFYGSQWGTASPDANGNLTFSGDRSGRAPRSQALLTGIATHGEPWAGVMPQSSDGQPTGTTTCPSGGTHVGYPTGGALVGVWYDNSVASPSQATGNQLATEAVNAAAHFGNTSATLNRSAQYVIVSPTGTHPDGFNTPSAGWCAWHDYNGDATLSGGAAPSTYGDIAFTNLPYLPDMGTSCGANFVNAGSAGALDGVSIVEGHEYAETLTDQNAGYGYYDNSSGMENGDKCAWIAPNTPGGSADVSFATGAFAMQSTWSNANNACEIAGPIEGATSTNDFSVALSPTSGSVLQGSSLTATVSTATTSGTAQPVTFSASGLPVGAGATFSPTTVTSGASSTLTITTSSTTSAGTYPITITGTAGTLVHSTSYTLTVTSPVVAGTFSISVSPGSGSTTAGHSVSTTVKTATTSGSAQTVTLSATGVPSGVSASFSPLTVASGSSATLTFKVAKRVHSGTARITIVGTGASSSASTTYTLTY